MKETQELPPLEEMYLALLRRDSSYEGIFYVAVRTTGIFCRPTCSARKPLQKNVEFFRSTAEALFSGYRPCLRCYPMEPASDSPQWLRGLLNSMALEPSRRFQDEDLRSLGMNPRRVQRWFKKNHSMTFHAYQRAQRLGKALGRLKLGEDIMQTALDSGFESLSGFGEALRKLVGNSPARSRDKTLIHLTRIQTPLGPMVVGATEDALCLLEFADRRMLETQCKRIQKAHSAVLVPGETEISRMTAREIDAYFEGSLQNFTIPLKISGTKFQEIVWSQLQTIPYASTRSYAEQASLIERPTAVRAVARANGDNRIAIIIPCHRVIGSDGKLTGYGGGLWRKQRLLEWEKLWRA
ncbi:methylated-DNA--[protein]-cysteine S-methyltransferase [bacterium]|nr:methylated-DNA--[protein]-cysteine S-methyltransferase [bacterium]